MSRRMHQADAAPRARIRVWVVVVAPGLLALGVMLVMGAPVGATGPARFALALAGQFLAAAATFPCLRRRRAVRMAAVVAAAIPIALAPLVIPAPATLARFLAAIMGVGLVAKLYDVHLAAGRSAPPDLSRYLYFLPNPAMVLRKLPLEPQPSARQNRVALAGALAAAAGTVVALLAAQRVDWAAQPFALEHGMKATIVFAGVVAFFSTLVYAGRVAGATTRDFADAPWRARTPAEFWQRYNRCVGQFFYEDVYKPLRRKWPPGVAVLMTFAASGILHEYVFGIATGRVHGYQLAFFMIQGVAVVATGGVKPRGRAALPATAATLVFIIASSVLFFASFHGVAPFYARGVPAWLWSGG
jgi:hypothetical protein